MHCTGKYKLQAQAITELDTCGLWRIHTGEHTLCITALCGGHYTHTLHTLYAYSHHLVESAPLGKAGNSHTRSAPAGPGTGPRHTLHIWPLPYSP
jgi:hypothetical protein